MSFHRTEVTQAHTEDLSVSKQDPFKALHFPQSQTYEWQHNALSVWCNQCLVSDRWRSESCVFYFDQLYD